MSAENEDAHFAGNERRCHRPSRRLIELRWPHHSMALSPQVALRSRISELFILRRAGVAKEGSKLECQVHQNRLSQRCVPVDRVSTETLRGLTGFACLIIDKEDPRRRNPRMVVGGAEEVMAIDLRNSIWEH